MRAIKLEAVFDPAAPLAKHRVASRAFNLDLFFNHSFPQNLLIKVEACRFRINVP